MVTNRDVADIAKTIVHYEGPQNLAQDFIIVNLAPELPTCR